MSRSSVDRVDPRRQVGVTVGVATLGRHRVGTEQRAGVLGNEPHDAGGVGRPECRGLPSGHRHRALRRGPQTHQMAEQRRLPDPLRPMTAVTSPTARSRSTSSRARSVP